MTMKPNRVLIRATLVVCDIYTCRKCGAQRPGDVYKIETEDPIDALSTNKPTPQRMPIGWASYLDGFDCPKHH